MSPSELIALWENLASGPRSAAGFDRRRVYPDSATDLFACVFWPSGDRGLMVEGGDDIEQIQRRVPKCRGVGVTLTTAFGDESKASIRIALEDDRLIEIFAVLAADLLAATSREKQASSGLRQALDRFAMWQGLLDRLPAEGLPPDLQRGLFGELAVMEAIHLPILGPLEAVLSWAGPDSANQDFTTSGTAIEVKSSLAKRHSRLPIANEKQLDEEPFSHLFLAHVRLDESAAHGTSLPDLVQRMRIAVGTDPVAAVELEPRLLKYGYLAVHEPLYASPKYLVASLRLFEVKGSFPRLTEHNLPPGVGDIRYSIVADDLSAYEVVKEQCLRSPGDERWTTLTNVCGHSRTISSRTSMRGRTPMKMAPCAPTLSRR